ncbi:MAG TPA: DUF1294 domain-containing protein [Methanoregula sp.]|nr:DUF1294 domain-containing protein [Methanoregula sp.]
MNSWLLPLAAVLAVANGGSLFLFAWDKGAAVFRWWRVPERRLLAAALIGPFGACAGMILFRHKIRNPRFALVPAGLAAQTAALFALLIVYRPFS